MANIDPWAPVPKATAEADFREGVERLMGDKSADADAKMVELARQGRDAGLRVADMAQIVHEVYDGR